jgi:hypothetical protein
VLGANQSSESAGSFRMSIHPACWRLPAQQLTFSSSRQSSSQITPSARVVLAARCRNQLILKQSVHGASIALMTIRTVCRSDSSRSASSVFPASNASVTCTPISLIAERSTCLSRAASSRRTACRWCAMADTESVAATSSVRNVDSRHSIVKDSRLCFFSRATGSSWAAAPSWHGVLLGLLFSGIVAILTFVAHCRLPYWRMVVLTGVLLGIVLLVMVGEQAQEMQLAHWLPTTEILWLTKLIPSWLDLWFSVFPSVETLCALAIAILLVLGSYVAARLRLVPYVRDDGFKKAA